MKIIILLFITVALFSCTEKENKSINEPPILYNISGKIETNSYSESVVNLHVELIGQQSTETYTDSSGYFSFDDINEGEYKIKISDDSVVRIDTTVIINSPLNLTFQLNELLIDYLPVKINSVYEYHFNNYPYGGSEYEYVQEGTITWEVIEVNDEDKKYTIREVVEGSWTNKYPNNLESPNFGPDTSITEFKVIDNLWLEVNLSFLEISHNIRSLEIMKYFPANWSDEITISNEEWWVDYDPNTYIRSIHNFHRIRLRKGFGLVFWHCGGISNGAKNFTLTLVE